MPCHTFGSNSESSSLSHWAAGTRKMVIRKTEIGISASHAVAVLTLAVVVAVLKPLLLKLVRRMLNSP